MIIKGSSRSAPKQLAKHLLRTDTNEQVRILELTSPTGNLTEAFRDWQCLADGTLGTKGLYHANIDPEARYDMNLEQWHRAADVLEEALGLQGQPRAVVLHEKKGRQHIHVVWQRTDIDTMTLRSDSWNYRAHEVASRSLEQEFGHAFTPGKHAKRDRSRSSEPPRAAISHAEWQQAERLGLDPRERKAMITALFAESENGQEFKAQLEDAGYTLAQGDRRDYALVDRDGDVFNVTRQINGMRAKELRAFMADVDPAGLPTVSEVKQSRVRDVSEVSRAAETETPSPQQSSTLESASIENIPMREQATRHAEQTRELQHNQEQERARVTAILNDEITQKLTDFDALQKAANDRLAREQENAASSPEGLLRRAKEYLSPKLALDRQEREAREQREREEQNAKAHAEYEQKLMDERDKELAELAERHAQQQRVQDERQIEDIERERRQAEREAEMQHARETRQKQINDYLSRDGPEDEHTR